MSKNHPTSGSLFAIVSPCSTCNNQLSSPDPTLNLPACPRRRVAALQQSLDSSNLDSSQLDPLVLTGSEDTGGVGLINPVYSDAIHSVLVWYATLNENMGQWDASGNVISPNILDPSFDTKYIRCNQYPTTPSDPESTYYAKGAWQENDQIHVVETSFQQEDPASTDIAGSSPVLINSFATKVQFAYNRPRTPVGKDFSVSGT